MDQYFPTLSVILVLAPLIAAISAGIFGQLIGRKAAHGLTIFGVAISLALSLVIFKSLVIDDAPPFNGIIYTWGVSGNFHFNVGFLIDKLTATMMVVVTFVSLLVHIYSVGYMHGDSGYQRFFSYMSLFTFAMLMLVMANNFLQLYFGWEGVGLVSYLLIGFWFHKDSANLGSLKAFLVNRVGDLGFLLGIAAILGYFGTLDYMQVFAKVADMSQVKLPITSTIQWPLLDVIGILLFIGAMGKSAQIPLHVWLPESMEGPTAISALIHAATMVTAGVFMVTRMSPIFEFSPISLSLILIVGATTAFFTGLIAVVQNDIKRVIAYSTLSQLGYMIAALGASAFAAGMLQLITHAFFKALLFLAAGSVIVALHHEQDMRKMGGLWKYMPITYLCFLIGALSLSAIPPFAGFYSKDSIIAAVHAANITGASYAYICVLLGAFITPLYIFRAFFLTFHTPMRITESLRAKLHESSWVIWLPLVILAIPAVISGALMIEPALFAEPSLFGKSIFVKPQYDVLKQLALNYHGVWPMIIEAMSGISLWLAIAGVAVAWLSYIAMPRLPELVCARCRWIYVVLQHKYGFDDFNQKVLVRGTRALAQLFYQLGDVKIIDGWIINGSGRGISWLSSKARKLQSGYVYHYTLAMILGLLVFALWLFV